MKKYKSALIIISAFFISCIQTKTPNISDLDFYIVFNETVNADLIVISPKEDAIYSIQDSNIDIHESSDTIYIDIHALTTGKGRNQVNFKIDTCIHYISLQNKASPINSIRRK